MFSKRYWFWLFACLLLLLSSTAYGQRGLAIQDKRVALVIGNGAYESSPLKNPVNDANDMAAALKSLGFKTFHFTNIDKREMIQAFDIFSRELRRADVGLFYYAGHGMQIRGRNFIIPTHVYVTEESDVEFEAVDMNRLLQKMSNAGNDINIVILDACRNNPFERSFRSSTSGLARMDAPIGTFIAFATAPGSVAEDGEGRNGVFTKHLVNNMRIRGLKIEDVMKRTRVEVLKETNQRQVPWQSSSLTGDFMFAGSQKPESKKPVVATPSPAAKQMPVVSAKSAPRIEAQRPAPRVEAKRPAPRVEAQRPAPRVEVPKPAPVVKKEPERVEKKQTVAQKAPTAPTPEPAATSSSPPPEPASQEEKGSPFNIAGKLFAKLKTAVSRPMIGSTPAPEPEPQPEQPAPTISVTPEAPSGDTGALKLTCNKLSSRFSMIKSDRKIEPFEPVGNWTWQGKLPYSDEALEPGRYYVKVCFDGDYVTNYCSQNNEIEIRAGQQSKVHVYVDSSQYSDEGKEPDWRKSFKPMKSTPKRAEVKEGVGALTLTCNAIRSWYSLLKTERNVEPYEAVENWTRQGKIPWASRNMEPGTYYIKVCYDGDYVTNFCSAIRKIVIKEGQNTRVHAYIDSSQYSDESKGPDWRIKYVAMKGKVIK